MFMRYPSRGPDIASSARSLKRTLTHGKSSTDLPWADHEMAAPRPIQSRHASNASTRNDGPQAPGMPDPTVAAFSPNQQTSQRIHAQSSVIIHQKSPLLVATPPQVTRALAYSHPFILPLNHLAGLISWTTGDPWESFFLLCIFWFTTLYAGYLVQWLGPIVFAVAMVLGMHGRRFSPLSSTVWGGNRQSRQRASSDSQQRKSLDEILDTLQTFTNRCEILLDPLAQFAEFLSTQVSATSASTRPALTSMFLRLLAVTPVWFILSLPPLHIITTRCVIMVLGTVILTWHSQVVRASRAILWRSRSIRSFCSVITGLQFAGSFKTATPLLASTAQTSAANRAGNKGGAGVRFTFSLFENQRKWVALGYTSNLFPNERSAWTDELLNATPSKDDFPLPETDSETHRWRWVADSKWKVDEVWTDDGKAVGSAGGDAEGWTYYDNKWKVGSKAEEWGKWTRRRRWIRDAELIEVPVSEIRPTTATSSQTTLASSKTPQVELTTGDSSYADAGYKSGAESVKSTKSTKSLSKRKKGWFGKQKETTDKVPKLPTSATPANTTTTSL